MLRLALVAAVAWGVSAVPADAQWTVAAYTGRVHTERSDLVVTQPDAGTEVRFRRVAFDGRSLDSPIYYGYRIGRAVRGRWLYAEAEFIHAKAFARLDSAPVGTGTLRGARVDGLPAAQLVQQFAMSHGINFILVNVVVRRPIGGSRVHLVARAGVGPVLPHAETRVDGTPVEGYQWAGAGTQAGGGLELRLWRRLYGSFEYKITSARPRVEVHGGHATLAARSHHVTGGATWRVGN